MKRPVSKADLPALRQIVQDYDRYRVSKGLEPSTWWADRIRAVLEENGIVKPKPKAEAP
jgi:hypothetical protein